LAVTVERLERHGAALKMGMGLLFLALAALAAVGRANDEQA